MRKELRSSIDFSEIFPTLAYKFDGLLDLSEGEEGLTVTAASLQPSVQEVVRRHHSLCVSSCSSC